MSDSLRGQLLVASPALIDPNFRRGVVLVVAHDEEGAVGLLLNRRTEAEVAEAVPELADLVDPDAVVSIGGPVQTEAVVVLAEWDEPDEAGAVVFDDIGLMGSEADSDEVAAVTRRVRVFAGYAGWGGGQLEAELDELSWVVESADAEDVFGENGDLWADVLRRKGGAFKLVATMPEDPRSTSGVQFPHEPQALERQPRVDELDRPRVRRDQVREAAGRDRACFRSELAADARDDLVHLPDEAVDEPRLQRRGGRLADHRRRCGELHAEQARGALEERVHRDLDPGREDAAEPLAVRGDDVEVRRRSEVDDDRGHAVALLDRDGVRYAIWPDLARIVRAHGNTGAHTRAENEQPRRREPRDEVLVRTDERRHGRRERHAVDLVEIRHERLEKCAEFVTTSMRLRRDTPVIAKRFPVVEPEDGLRVADVDREQHVVSNVTVMPPRTLK